MKILPLAVWMNTRKTEREREREREREKKKFIFVKKSYEGNVNFQNFVTLWYEIISKNGTNTDYN